MALTAYTRLRAFWGAFDYATDANRAPGYSSSQYANAGASAAVGAGVGIRRATCVLNRSAFTPALDTAIMHFDFLNMTAGVPDDTWVTADFTTLEGYLKTMFTSLVATMQPKHTFDTVSWHRIGPGAPVPNPAERIATVSATQPTGTGSTNPPQIACSITFRTGVRKSWGRTYLPCGISPGAQHRWASTNVDVVATAVDTMVKAAAAADFYHVVFSKTLNSALNVEAIEVDDVPDVIRRRRHKVQTYRKIINS